MRRNLLVCVLFFFTSQLYADDYYWVGGGGNWSDLANHWRLGSPTGSTPSIVPSATDNVFFGSYSGFTAANRTVTLNTNAFCNNMTWEAGVANNPLLSRGGASTLFISGNLILQPSMGYIGNVNVEFTGSAPATLTTNGSFTGIFNININKPGSGLTLLDDLIYTGSTSDNNHGLTLTEGYLNASGKTVSVYNFTSQNNNNRHLDITGGVLTTTRNYYFTGSNKTMDTDGSIFKIGLRLFVDGGEYDTMEAATASPNNDLYGVNNTTFRKLVFTNTSPTSNARIHANNVVDSLVFMGAGHVRSGNNQINYVTIAGNGTVGGANNVIGYMEIAGTLNIIDDGGHVFDTLLVAPNKDIWVRRTITINKYFRAGGAPCDGFTEITGTSDGTINFAAGAVAEIDNVLLTNMAATGSLVPLTVNGIDNEGNTGFIINTPTAASRTLYWVGGPGDWNDRNHWSEESGGDPGACIPFIEDDVVFDGNSGLNGGGTVATTGNTYCRNMTWAAGISGSPIFSVSGNFYMQVYGSVVLNPNVTMNGMLDMRGTEAVTFTTNGSTKGNNRILVRKSAEDPLAGGVTLTDDWTNPSGSFQLNRGHLNLAGKAVNINIFTSNVSNGRHVDMQGSDITVNRWEYRAGNKTLEADNSKLTITGSIYVAGMVTYDAVDVTTGSLNTDNFSVTQTGFRELLFSNPSLVTAARIDGGNIIERLEFMGQGAIAGTGNVIDSLITGENRNLWLAQGSNTINEYFRAVHPDCSGLGEIRSLGTGSTIVFGADADVDVANVYMENITASGGGGTLTLPIAFSGADAGGNAGWTIIPSDGDARYWIGGGGDWNDASHWSTESGGPGGACVPTVANDVYFDANSGFGTTAASRTITVNNGNAYFRNMDWTGAANNPILNRNAAWNMEAWGESIVLNPAVTLNATFQLRGAAATVMTGQTLGNFDLELRKPGGSFTIANDYSNNQTDIFLYEGALIASGIALTVNAIDNENRNNNAVDISGSTVNLAGLWRYSGPTANRMLDVSDAVINTVQFIAQGFTYHQVNIGGTGQDHARFSDIVAGKITFTQTNVISGIGINGTNNQLDTVEYKGGGAIYGTGNTIGTLIFFPGSRYMLTSGTNTTVTNAWFGSGTPCQLTEIWSSNASAVATVIKASGAVDFDYVRLQAIAAVGGAEFAAGSHSLDLGGSTGWDIAPYDGASPIEGLGPDISLADAEFPYTISTAGFFGSPLSRYEWKKDGIVVGTADELVVTEPGEYAIKVDFPDGCMVLDTILIARDSADLVVVKALKDPDQEAYVPGEEVVYTITVTNNGPDDAVNVVVTDQAPEDTEMTAWSATVTAGTVDLPNASGTGNLAETIALLPDGATVVYEVTLATESGRMADLSNTVEVTSPTPDPEPDCDACTTAPLPAAPEASVSVAKVVNPGTQESYIPGEAVAYTITVTNDGPSDAREVVIADTAPAGTAITGWTATVTTGTATLPDASGNGDLNETIAVLPSGAVVTYEITVQTPADYTEDLSNTAAVSSDTEDPDDADNTATTPGLPSVPAAPISDGDQEECAESPLQTLTATATVPDGTTIVWYDAPTGGNVVADASLDAVGTVTYYAEARKGTLASLTRTAVTLTINALPTVVITDPAVACAGSTIDLTAAAVTEGSDVGLTYAYYTDAAGTDVLANPAAVTESGTYYITGTNPATGCRTTMPVVVQFVDRPVVTLIHPDCAPDGTGTITVTNPVGTGFEYSINGVDYQTDPVFENVAPGTYNVTARHVSVSDCVSDVREVTISDRPTTYMPVVIQPDCDSPLGQIILPENPDYEYAVYPVGGTPTYQQSEIFNDVAPGEYLVQMRSVSIDCEAEPVSVTVDEAPIVPDAPVSGGDIAECATAPLQTLTATATAPAEVTITWYDAPTGGNVVASPTLNSVGTVTFFAEASNGTCVSTSRTPVTLTINALPVIDVLDDQVVCGAFTLPDITGTNLTGDKAYYAEAGGAGTRYEIGETITVTGTYTLYQYATTVDGCVAESSFVLTINETPTAGTIGSDQAICYGEVPAELMSTAAGTGTGTVVYRWEMSADGGASWLPVAGAAGAAYQPEALTVTTLFRRITVATASGLTCESAPTDAVEIVVADELFADAGADQSQVNDADFTLAAATPALGAGQWSVVSGTPSTAVSDVNDPAATVSVAPGESVTLRWTVTNGSCAVFDEVTLTHLVRSFSSRKAVVDANGDGVAQAGEALTYTIAVTNTGDVDLTGVTIVDEIPLGTTYIDGSATATGGSFAGDEVAWTINVPAGGTVNVRFSVTVVEDVTGLDDITNTALVADPVAGTQQPFVTISVGAERTFTAAKSVADASGDGLAQAEEELTYSITVENTGDVDLLGVTIRDVIPTGTAYVAGSADADGGVFDDANGRIDWLLDIPFGTSVTVNFGVTVAADLTGIDVIANTAVVSDPADPSGTPREATAPELPVDAARGFTATKSVADASGDGLAQAGEVLTYTVTVTNTGNVALTGVTITDILPAGTTYVEGSADHGGMYDAGGNRLEWTVDVPYGQSVNVRFDVRVPADLTGLPGIANTATVTDAAGTIVPASSPTLPTDARAAFTAAKSVVDASGDGLAQAEEELTYSITVENTGDVDLLGVTIRDVIPTGTAYVAGSADADGGVFDDANGRIDWLLDIPFGTSVTVNFGVTVAADLTGIDVIANTAVVSDPADPSGTPREATAPELPVDAARGFAATKSVADASGDGLAQAGEVLTYTITVVNTGDADLAGLEISDVMPAGTSYVAGTADNGGTFVTAGNRLEWVTDVPRGGTRTVRFDVVVDSDPIGIAEIANTAVVVDPERRTDPVDASAPTLPVEQAATPVSRLAVMKTVDNRTPLVGETVVFTLEVVNNGPDDATGVSVLDKLPSGYTFVSYDASAGTYNEGSGVWSVGRLRNGGRATLRMTVTVNASGEYRNTARIEGNEADPDEEDNEGTVMPTPVHPPQALDDAVSGTSNRALTISVLANDVAGSHPLDAASIELVSQPQHGTVSVGVDGTVVYVSARGYVGEDRFSYRVQDSGGNWSNVAGVVVTVVANPLKVTNIFTPNGDGQNDRFEIVGLEGFDRAELVVFNRWGGEVYRDSDYDNSWGGGDIHEGTYYYILTLHKGNSRQVEKGWVVLKRR
ncbi:DUF7507 domain-containing protein [Parapedobacter luteus]|nr:gliding motility-associated C-terminal domain-containing protein [Parapedobacter luteus]